MNAQQASFFDTAQAFRTWLQEHGTLEQELWVGYWKKSSGRGGLTYAQSVDEALCFGWIDGLTRTIDAERYATRFTPRRARSDWSALNVKRVGELLAEGRMTEPGIRAFDARREPDPGTYTYETRPVELPEPYAQMFSRNEPAWRFWQAQRASYRKAMTWWVVQAGRDDTRVRRLDALIAASAAGHVLDEMSLPKLAPRRSDG